MDVHECIAARRAIRKYKDIPIEFEKIGKILDAGRFAPSAGNLQDWKFILVTDDERRNGIAEACVKQYWMQEAPVHIVVCTTPEKTARFYGEKGKTIYSLHNAAAAVQNMLLAATAEGLGSCWVGAFEEGALRKILKISDDVHPHAIITLGYPAESPKRPPKFRIEDVTFIEDYGSKIKDIAAYHGYYGARIQKAISKGREMFNKAVENKNR